MAVTTVVLTSTNRKGATGGHINHRPRRRQNVGDWVAAQAAQMDERRSKG